MKAILLIISAVGFLSIAGCAGKFVSEPYSGGYYTPCAYKVSYYNNYYGWNRGTWDYYRRDFAGTVNCCYGHHPRR